MATVLDVIDGLSVVADVRRLARGKRWTATFHSLLCGRLSRSCALSVEDVSAMLPPEEFVFMPPPVERTSDLPKDHYSWKSRLMDLVAAALLIDPGLVVLPGVEALSPDSCRGHVLEDVLIASRCFGRGLMDALMPEVEHDELWRLVELFLAGDCVPLDVEDYSKELMQILKIEAAFFAARAQH
jgi:hypothetical protein